MQHFDALIIGSGISSLVCAALLAKRGKSVCVLERYRKLGGYLHCFQRFGNNYDTGSHYVGSMAEGQSFRNLLTYLDAFDADTYIPLDPHGFDVFKFPDFEFNFPVGHQNAIDSLSAIFPEERHAITTYFDMVRTIAMSIPTYEFDDEADANKVIEYLNTPLSAVVNRLTNNQKLKCVFYAYCTLHCVHPDDTPFAFHAVMTDSLLRGAYGFRHGGDQLAASLISAIESKGGIVKPRSSVVAFDVKEESITCVKTHRGEDYSAEWVVSGIHPKATFALVGHENLPGSFLRRLHMITESVPFLGFYGACEIPPDINPLRNYYAFASDNPDDLSALQDPSRFNQTQTQALYLARNSRTSVPGKKGLHPITMHTPADYSWFKKWEDTRFADRPADYHAFKEELSKPILALAERYFPKLRTKINHFEVSTPLSNLHYNGSEDGSAYGIYHGIQQTGMRGLGPRTHIKNLLLTGQSTLFPGLLGSSIAGLRTAGHILGIKPILKELKALRS